MFSIIGGIGRAATSSWSFLQRTTASIFHSPLLAELQRINDSPVSLAPNAALYQAISQSAVANTAERATFLQNVVNKSVDKIDDFYPDFYIKNVIDAPSYGQGLACDISKVAAFHRKVKSDNLSAFRYIANNTNQNYLLGIFRNVLRFFSTGTLNQNCVFCSKAVDKNLAALEQGRIETFWVAQSTGRGSLPQNVWEGSYSAFVMQSEATLSSQLMARCREGSRNIIMVPVRNRHFSHAMNLVATVSGAMVIDGQAGRVYDLASTQGRLNFDRRYGVNHGLNLV